MSWCFRRFFRFAAGFGVLFAAIVALQTSTIAQTSSPTPPPPIPLPTPNVYEAVRKAEDEERRRANLNSVRDTRFGRVDRARQQRAMERQIDALYRKPDRDEKKLLRPSESFALGLEPFLKLSKTGLIKLIADRGCSESKNVVVASEHCIKYSMPGGGSSYSFRTKNHRIPRLSDLTFSDGMFQSVGALIRGILVDVGNVPIEQITLQSRGMKFLREYKLTTDVAEAIKADREFGAGVTHSGLVYGRSAPARMGTTYLLRSAAYRGPSYKAVEGFTYDEFGFDDRRDVVIAFRIIGEESDGITIAYRELESKRSPAIKSPGKNEALLDNKFTADRLRK